ncbi:hypothetical protein [Paractinoplanes toevensis]|uniref:Uncharacterized protein n=1 Tax=Paractinoplanes toevensis TaxID=571911 RepID=A0A919VY86_9ACTN|nr:hypothetical protein [Actinoplanes toevensis]GIM88727.1 hypothetical protein Ato02nite_005200 [Actinoplanes toevensis]
MTITDNKPLFATVEEVHEALTSARHAIEARAETVPEQPVYLRAVNPWRPWVARAGGVSIGAVLAAIAAIVVDQDSFYPATLTALGVVLIYAWVLGGYEYTEQHPTKFEKAA